MSRVLLRKFRANFNFGVPNHTVPIVFTIGISCEKRKDGLTRMPGGALEFYFVNSYIYIIIIYFNNKKGMLTI